MHRKWGRETYLEAAFLLQNMLVFRALLETLAGAEMAASTVLFLKSLRCQHWRLLYSFWLPISYVMQCADLAKDNSSGIDSPLVLKLSLFHAGSDDGQCRYFVFHFAQTCPNSFRPTQICFSLTSVSPPYDIQM